MSDRARAAQPLAPSLVALSLAGLVAIACGGSGDAPPAGTPAAGAAAVDAAAADAAAGTLLDQPVAGAPTGFALALSGNLDGEIEPCG